MLILYILISSSGKRNSNYVDTVETACSGKNIAKELSDIVIYLEPLKFLSFKVSNLTNGKIGDFKI